MQRQRMPKNADKRLTSVVQCEKKQGRMTRGNNLYNNTATRSTFIKTKTWKSTNQLRNGIQGTNFSQMNLFKDKSVNENIEHN